MARNPELNSTVAHILYGHFILGNGDIKAASKRAGISPSTLYEFCENRRDLPARLIEPLCQGDVELFAKLTGARELGFTVSGLAPEDSEEDPRDVALSVGAQTGRLLDAVLRAETDGLITEAELELIETERERLQRVAERLGAAARRRRMRVSGK